MTSLIMVVAALVPQATSPVVLVRDAAEKYSAAEWTILGGLTEERVQALRSSGRYVVSTLEGGVQLVVDTEIDDIADLRAGVAVLSALKHGNPTAYSQFSEQAKKGLVQLLPKGDVLTFKPTTMFCLDPVARITFVGPSGTVVVKSGLEGSTRETEELLRNPAVWSPDAPPKDLRRGMEIVYGPRLNGPDHKAKLFPKVADGLSQLLTVERRQAEREFAAYVSSIEERNKRLLDKRLLGLTGRELTEMRQSFEQSYESLTGNVGTYNDATLVSIDVDLFVRYAEMVGDAPPKYVQLFPIGFVER
jgi:hypothetical protein